MEAPHAFDRLALAAQGVSRRRLLRLSGGFALAAIMPRWARRASARAPLARAAAKTTGTCPPQTKQICVGGIRPWTPACSDRVTNGISSEFNGCGPQGGIDLPLFGNGDYVPDKPLNLANFFEACKGHDCCYGTCGSHKSQCDLTFLRDMIAICEATWPRSSIVDDVIVGQQYALCLTVAHIYYEAVADTSTGQDAYLAGQTEVCGCCIDCPTFANVYWDASASDAAWYKPCPVGDGSGDYVCTFCNDANNCGACGNTCASFNCDNGVCVD